MTDPKEFESLDELFRKTFDQLPQTPSPTGWDSPSEKVWQHVQSQIKPPRAGWSTQTMMLVAAFAVTVAVGVYLFVSRPTVPASTETPAPVLAVPESPALPTNETAATVPTASTENESPEVNSTARKPSARSHQTQKEMPAGPTGREISSTPSEITEKPPAKRPPNTTERLKAELAKRAKEAWEKPLSPLPPRWPGKDRE